MSTVSQTILDQLGGRGFSMITGSRNYTTSHEGRGLTFQVGSNSKGVTHVEIVLEASDTYTVRFSRLDAKTLKFTTLAEREDVYVEDLLDIFEDCTGLFATLGKR